MEDGGDSWDEHGKPLSTDVWRCLSRYLLGNVYQGLSAIPGEVLVRHRGAYKTSSP